MPRKRYGRAQPPDLWADSGPGDPGYRLRPGRTGFDPMETYADHGRFYGSLLASLYQPRLRWGLVLMTAIMVLIAVVFSEAWAIGIAFVVVILSMLVWTWRHVAESFKRGRSGR
jgi:hypothetical protein